MAEPATDEQIYLMAAIRNRETSKKAKKWTVELNTALEDLASIRASIHNIKKDLQELTAHPERYFRREDVPFEPVTESPAYGPGNPDWEHDREMEIRDEFADFHGTNDEIAGVRDDD